ncbi:unnamed protein product [Hymenolepis diminuta]|uniref:protein-tyrosine-phosphatase n=1 Tax=Hymenolepis diminuta TaxID=6216 RepID=A0A564YP23_HYMDI|nr:unnamed protein product [Hymenolepis diminuta]
MLWIFLLLHQFLLLHCPFVHSLPTPIDANSSNVTFAAHLFCTQQYARSGSNISLSCPPVEQIQNESVVLWTGPSFNHSLNSTDALEFGNIKLSLDGLTIYNISLQNQGNYSCFYNGNASLYWSIFVLDIPTLPTTLRLTANNESAISIHWRNKTPVPKSTIYEIRIFGSQNETVNVSAVERRLTIDGLDPYSKYFVSLTPYDKLGAGVETWNESICTDSGVPTATPTLTLDSFTNTSVSLNFSAGEISSIPDGPFTCPGTLSPRKHLNGPFKGYRLTLEALSFKSIINMTVNNQTESYTLNRLLPYTSYRVNLSLSNGRKFGPPKTLNFTTLEGVPEPPSLQVESRSTDSIRVSFSSSDNRGIVLGYYLRWAECSNSSTVDSAETEDSYFDIKGLRNATCYRLAAAARTSVGMGNLSPLTEGFTTCSAFSAPILSNISAISEGIKVSWIFNDAPASPDGNHWFRPCMKSSVGICKDVPFNSTFQQEGVFSYTFSFSEVNRLWDHEVIFNFTVQTICLPRDCKIDWPCLEVSNLSNILQLDLDHLDEMLFQPSGFGELSDKAIGSIIGSVFVIFLMICCASVVAFIYCRSSRVYKRRGMGLGGIGDDFSGGSGGLDRLDDARTPLVAPKMRRFEDSPHKPIPAEKLAAHVASYHVDDDAGYQTEFDAIEQSVRTSWPTSVARQPDNMAKNRYTNVFAYDHTRVILKNGRKSDYINANYVDGFCRPRAFIAAQGPKDTTFDDFWQMVWDENSNIIVMISNFVERGRRKCDQYWPSSGPQPYGNISVQMLSENYLACYVARVFLVKNVKCKKFAKERIVRHYQYTDWRDFDVPPSPLPVLVFVKTTIKEWTPSRGPIIVHCSAGVGRTGTYICIESLIRQLEAENQVNIRGFLEHIRQQRMKLVQTEQQYAFIHDALREYLLCPEHEISAMAFPSYVQCLRMPDANGVTGLQKQFEICTDYMPRVYEFTEARKPVNIPKNRLSRRLLPTDSRRVALPSEGGIEGASYINASVVQGYHRLHEFIVTQHPIPNSTETDFWRMVWDKNSPLVVVLSSSDSENGEFPDFWPTEAHDPREIGWLRVGFCASETVGDGLTRYEFLLSSSREDYALTCQLWRLHNWPSSTNDEVACSDLLKLQSVLISNSSSTANGSTIVVDDYGGNRAGIFVAVNFLINQFNLSGNIDIYYIVKMLHLQRTGIFQSPADLEFIYSLMEQFLMEIQQQDDSSSFLGGCNETSSSPGYANLSLFNGKSLLPPLTTSNSKCSSADGDVLPPKSTTLFPLIASVESEDEKILENDELRSTPVIVPETESALELHSLSSDATAGDSSVNPSLIGVLTPVKRPLNNGFVVKETILPHPLPPPPNQSPPAWPVDDLDGSDDPTPTTSLVIEGGESSLHLNGTVDEMTV